jgi:hypothetical protein
MFALCGNRTRDLLRSKRVFPPLRQIGRHSMFSYCDLDFLIIQTGVMWRVTASAVVRCTPLRREVQLSCAVLQTHTVRTHRYPQGGRPKHTIHKSLCNYYPNFHNVHSTEHQTIHFRLCTALISRALEPISNYKWIAWLSVDRTPCFIGYSYE